MEINIHEAKTHFSKLLQRVAAGEEVIIAKAGKPIAKLTAITPSRKPRKVGSAAGKFVLPPEFDDPLPEWFLASFE